jgi:predicted acyltransferase
MNLMQDMIKKNERFRLLSLDVFRGLTIALMILVNSPGNQTPYYFLDHSAWNGCTLADLVFPFFVFVVGVSAVFSLSQARYREKRGALIIKICKRSLIIFFIGLFLNAFPEHFDLASIRVFGVLQRIAICYFFSAILFLTTRLRTQAVIIAVLLIGYWLLMTLPAYNLTEEGNFAAYIDRMFLSPAHLYGKYYDPEGFFSTFPAVATALLGNLTAAWLLSNLRPAQKKNGMVFMGILALSTGWLWAFWFPINKTLWTSSFVLWTGGFALLILAFCYWLIEIKHWHKWSKPFEFFGVNAMAAYVLHVFFLKIQVMIRIPHSDGSSPNLKSFFTEYLFGWTSTQNAALLYALCYTLIWFFILTILYRKRIFIKI